MKSKLLLLIMMFLGFMGMKAEKMQRFEAKVGEFKHLVVVDDINVEYICNPDSAGLAVFTTVPAMANQMIFSNNGKGKLQITVGTDSVMSPRLPLIKVYSTFLQEAVNDGDSTLTITKIAPCPTVKFKLSDNGRIDIKDADATDMEIAIVTGKGEIVANGKCTNLSIRNMGTGTIMAENVKAKDVSCRLLGTGKVYCTVDDGILTIKGSGTGKVYYYGTPKEIKSFQIGTIKAIHMNK